VAVATNQQVQDFNDERLRPFSEAMRAVFNFAVDVRATIDDVYNNVNDGGTIYTDTRTDGPPHLLTPADVLALNGFCEDFKSFVNGHAAKPVVMKACVRALDL